MLSIPTKVPPTKYYYVGLISLLCRIFGYKKWPQLCIKRKLFTFVHKADLFKLNNIDYHLTIPEFIMPLFNSVAYGKHSYLGPTIWAKLNCYMRSSETLRSMRREERKKGGGLGREGSDSRRVRFLPDICSADIHKTAFSAKMYTVLNELLNGL